MKKRHKWITDEHSEHCTRQHCADCDRQSERRGRWKSPLYWNGPQMDYMSDYAGHCDGRKANGC